MKQIFIAVLTNVEFIKTFILGAVLIAIGLFCLYLSRK